MPTTDSPEGTPSPALLPIRHGDVVLYPLAVWPDRVRAQDLRRVEAGPEGVALTTSSATGHEHTVQGDGVEVYEAEGGGRVIRVLGTARLVHAGAAPRHEPIELAAGDYWQGLKRVYSIDGGWEPVAD